MCLPVSSVGMMALLVDLCVFGTCGYVDDLCIGVYTWLVCREEKNK